VTNVPQPPFDGFLSEEEFIRLPEGFFTRLLLRIDDPGELRLLLYLFWHLEKQERKVRHFKLEELTADPALIDMMGNDKNLMGALRRLIELGAVLEADFKWKDETYYFINTPQGQAAVSAIENGEWLDPGTDNPPIQMAGDQPNIFKLYEENIGAITPIMAEILKADEAAYPPGWIEEAIRIAVARNARNWKYVQAILERWQKEGHGNEQNRRDNSQDSISYRESWLGKD
jgi:DNA replication protein